MVNKKCIKIATIAILIHFTSFALILIIPNISQELFAWRPFGINIPVVVASLLITMIISGLFGVIRGLMLIKEGVRKWWFLILVGLGIVSIAFWTIFFIGEIVSPH